MTQQGYPFTLSKRILLKWGHDNYLRKTPALSMESANSRVVGKPYLTGLWKGCP